MAWSQRNDPEIQEVLDVLAKIGCHVHNLQELERVIYKNVCYCNYIEYPQIIILGMQLWLSENISPSFPKSITTAS